jgi:hypothetical protein
MTLGSGIDGDAGDFDLRRVVAALVDRCDRLAGENEELKVENESLRDEIRRLKGLPPRPKFKPKPPGYISRQDDCRECGSGYVSQLRQMPPCRQR